MNLSSLTWRLVLFKCVYYGTIQWNVSPLIWAFVLVFLLFPFMVKFVLSPDLQYRECLQAGACEGSKKAYTSKIAYFFLEYAPAIIILTFLSSWVWG